MSNPTGSDPNHPQGGAQGQPGWGAPQQPGYGAPQQPGYGTPQQPDWGAPQQPGYGAPQQPGYPQQGYSPAPAYAGGHGAAPSMGMPDAVRSVLGQYANFSGRARRSEFWWFCLASFLASIVASVIDVVVGSEVTSGAGIFEILLLLALLIPTLAVGARRLHDTGRTGWWQLIAIVPLVGIIVLIVFWAQEGHPNPNQHGPSPKFAAATGY
jgi:uncharacterized membrane protein YhaH (DUF805 family)